MHYVIVGAGPAGVIAAETLRRTDSEGQITIIGDEPEPPYSRMAIPYLLVDNIGEAGTHLRKQRDHYEQLGIEIKHDRVNNVETEHNRVDLEGGTAIDYDRLLVASGSKPVLPPVPGIDSPGVYNCWTLEDARHIIEHTKPGARVTLIGAGFIGCIILEALASRGVKLTVVEMGDRMVPRMMNETAGGLIKRWCESKDIRVLTSTGVSAVDNRPPAEQQESGGLKGFFGRLTGKAEA
jgi:NADPH-dependent 2,4-dienoyl-CoA reductase/sulfur reductase-like enzyme